ncbi:MAG: response regulator [Myxococcales bacterium]|nr:response regulator [Myxococcales bacterium]
MVQTIRSGGGPHGGRLAERRRRVLRSTALALCAVAAFYTLLYAVVGAYVLMGLDLVAIAGCLAVLPLHARSPVWAANVCTASGYLCLAASLVISGGFEARFVFWLVVIPLIGGMLGGLRTGLVWAAITAATLFAFVGLFVAGVQLPIWIPLQLPPSQLFLQTAGIIGVVTLTMSVFLINQSFSDDEARLARERLTVEYQLRRRAEEERVASLGLLAGGFAHDFNNLLASTTMNLELLRDQVDDDEAHQLVSEISDALRTGTALTAQLLTFASGGSPVTEAADLGGLLEKVCSYAVRGSPVNVVFSVSPDVPPVAVNTNQIAHVFRNLALNARQAMQEGGTLQITASSPSKEWVAVDFTDDGVGISPEAQPRIFDPYFTERPGGTGLGLAIARSVAERHGGRLTVTSAPGRGATFRLLLPASPTDDPQLASEEAPVHALGRRVLLLDDDRFVRRAVERSLRWLGHEVDSVADGAEALAAYALAKEQGTPYDVVIFDLTIPGGMGGVQAMAALRERHGDVVVGIAASGYSPEDALAQPGDHGFRVALQKPFTQADLKDAIERCLA